MKILIQGGRLIDPASQTDRVADVAIAAGRIIGIGPVRPDFAQIGRASCRERV